MKKLFMVGNTHFDPVWLWKWEEAMASIRATLHAALARMKEDSDFIYSFATPPVFEWIRRVEPAMLEEIKQYVKEGRWELAEGWWVQSDCYTASGESYIRQGLYGQKYLLEHFGQMSETVFNVDSFGHPSSFPQILKKSHIKQYCFVRPEARHLPLEHPLFSWKGIDGTQIPTYRAAGVYKETIEKALSRQENDTDDALIIYGVTDHGGAPTKALLQEIHELPNAQCSTVSRFFAEQGDVSYTVARELITKDFGVYSNHPEIKKYNRIAEYAVLNAEKAARLADSDCQKELTACWQDILFNQFHDILGGACIKDAYFDARNTLGRAIQTANEITHFSLQKITAQIQSVGKNPQDIWNLVIWNLNGADFDGYLEAEVQWAHEFPWYENGICLEDEHGNQTPCQVIASKAVIPGFRSRFVFKQQIPAMGYKTLKVVKNDMPLSQRELDPFSFETNRLQIEFDRSSGTLHRVVDKKSKEILFQNILRPVAYYDDGDTWAFNIEKYDSAPIPFSLDSVQVLEAGELRTTVKVIHRMRDSILSMYYTFYQEETYFDLRYSVNWNEKHLVLKLESQTDSNRTHAAIPYGLVDREESAADVPMSQYVMADGIAYVCDAIFSYNATENRLGLTVLRSPIYGDLRIRDINYDDDYDILSQGISEGKIRITRQAYSPTLVDHFLNPPTVIDEANHSGTLPCEWSYVQIESDGVAITAIKKCEYGTGDIVRLFEYTGKRQRARLSYFNDRFEAVLEPFEIKTLKIENGHAEEYYMTEDIPYHREQEKENSHGKREH